MTYYMIDPPVSPYSSKGEIQAWLDELERMEQTPEVKMAIEDAKRWLTGATGGAGAATGKG